MGGRGGGGRTQGREELAHPWELPGSSSQKNQLFLRESKSPLLVAKALNPIKVENTGSNLEPWQLGSLGKTAVVPM